MSVARTCPVAPTRRAALRVCPPAPAATSNTRDPAPTPVRSSISSVASPRHTSISGPSRAMPRPQRERDRGCRSERVVSAQEVELQGVGRAGDRTRRWLGLDPGLADVPGAVRPDRVQEFPPRDRDQPALRVRRRVLRPRRQRPNQRLPHGVLGRREVCSTTDEDAGDRGNQLSQQRFVSLRDGGVAVRNGHSSSHSQIGAPPGPGAAEYSPVTSTARS